MMKFKKNYLGMATLIASLSLVAPACGSDKSSDGETGDTSSGTGSDSAATEESGEWSGGTDDATATGTTETTGTDTTETTAGFVTDTGDTTDTTGTGPQPNGSPCGSDAECDSDICVQIPGLGGVCSECETDQDCVDAGTGLNCSLGSQQYFACTDGGLGTMCMTDDGCEGDLVCATVVDLGGLFNDQFCSECGTDADCADGEQCAPNFDLGNFAGYRECIPAGSLMQDALCDVNDQCATGFCSEADIMGFLQLGVCGECLTDADCTGQATCMPAEVDLMGGGLSGSTCG